MAVAFFIMFEIEIKNFSLKNTFENGQCFRFNRYKEGYLGIACGRAIYLCQDGDKFTVDGVNEDEFQKYFVPLFDLDRDYNKITQSFFREENLDRAIEYGKGLRIMAQDRWETLVSFIISQNNNIARIKSIIERICLKYGDEIEFDGNIFYSFPTAEQLKNATEEEFACLGCGYRSSYLVKTVKEYLQGNIDFDYLASIGYENAKAELCKMYGIGPKVADCVALFGLNYLNAFPVDTWIKKVMESLFLKRSATKTEISAVANELFGEYAGIAQQYLFYYARENKIKGI